MHCKKKKKKTNPCDLKCHKSDGLENNMSFNKATQSKLLTCATNREVQVVSNFNI